MKLTAALLFAALLALPGCGTNPFAQSPIASVVVQQPAHSPEFQIKTGNNAHEVASNLGTTLLKNDRITVAQAKSFSLLLHAAAGTLDNALATLVTCRKATGSNERSAPDPCAFGVLEVVKLATDSIAGVKVALDKK